ncbi:hypothetical protein GCM10016455_05650 [Aliiroseovarius zhejiangensis]|uniref:Uncharacterized protein n=1 Tax=Aliiroseovarius zhejiangensis TaxID=1632025 RepID=A0ABQ3IP38_9RHOB|nr:hypothetical protein [Aliiroseovarius zhejiangensis]GHE88390.1 hypothetical protein GCM10016455_05650 [Aliiroseovarius zhejiangensis]
MFVDNWKDFWRWHSTYAIAFLAGLPVAWAELPADIKAMIPPSWIPWIMLGLWLAAQFVRLRRQAPSQ